MAEKRIFWKVYQGKTRMDDGYRYMILDTFKMLRDVEDITRCHYEEDE